MTIAGQQVVMESKHGIDSLPLAFSEVLRANQAMVFSIAYHFLQDRGAAEEIAQDVFLQLYRSLDALETAAHATFWLRKVTSNRSVDCLRKRRLRACISLDDAPEPSVSAEPGDPLLNRQLRKLIASLPEKPRMVMVLRYQEDLQPQEIARILEMPVRTVKSHLQRSLAILRTKIGGTGGTG